MEPAGTTEPKVPDTVAEPASASDEARGEEPREETREGLTGMSFLEHLEELRRRVIYSLLSVAAGFSVAWYFAERIFDLMQRPIVEALRNHKMDEKLVYLNPTEPFNLYLKVGLVAGLFLASPLVLYQVWLFISPGLYRREKRYVMPFLVFTVGLFLAGGYFGYRLVYPAALDFLLGYGEQFRPMITISEYTDLFLTVIVGLGVVFELPVVIFFLARVGVVTPGFLMRHFRWAVLIVFVVAAIITPTPDVFTLCLFAVPTLLLYLLGVGAAALFGRKRSRDEEELGEAGEPAV